MQKLVLSFIAAAAVAPLAWTADDLKPADDGQVTYSKEIARIMQDHCVECHRPGQIGPFSLTNYRQVKGWGKMIKEVVLNDRMPPWDADPKVGHFANDPSLTAEEKEQLAAWVDGGMPRGNPADMPEQREFSTDWRIGEPDVVFEMPEAATIQPTGVVPYVYFRTPTNFTEDKWVQAMEARAGNPKVVHHILLFAQAPEAGRDRDDFQGIGAGFLTGYAPGTVAHVMEPGEAVKIPAGADIVWQMHYTPTGKLETDKSQFAIKFADAPPAREMLTGTAQNFSLKIPPHAKDVVVPAEKEFPKDALLYSMTPHMHYRGSEYQYILEYPDGEKELLLNIPTYDFNWQLSYELAEPKLIPAGSTLHCIGTFDNSADNPYNPDPDSEVTWGDQTWEEMQIGWFTFTWDVDAELPQSEVQTD